MRLITAFILTLILTISSGTEPTVNEDDRGEQFSWDSSDNDETGSTQSYNGIIIQVYQNEDDSPVITLGTDKDDHENIYCFHLKGIFESEDYDTSVSEDATFNKLTGSEVDLADADCIINQVTSTKFTIICDNINGSQLILTFVFNQHHVFDYGLEYTLSLKDYSFQSNLETAKLVFVQSLTECSKEYPHSADSEENDEDNNNNDDNTDNDDGEDTTEAPEENVNDIIDIDDISTSTSTETPGTTTTDEADTTNGRRRVLLDDDEGTDIDEEEEDEEEEEEEEGDKDDAYSNSMDEDDGISSDDPNEFDAGTARFVVDGQAFDKCADVEDKAIESKLVHQSNTDELHIVFDHFDCDLSLDPFVGLDDTKYGKENDKAMSIQNIIAIIIGLIITLLL